MKIYHLTYPIQPLVMMLFLAAMASFLFSFTTPSLADESCGSLVQNKCMDCHFETRTCQKLRKKKGKSSWKRTIKSMVRHGAKLSKGEQKTLVQCFTSRDASVLSICGLDK